jgi:hypothetical protein
VNVRIGAARRAPLAVPVPRQRPFTSESNLPIMSAQVGIADATVMSDPPISTTG